MKKLLNKNNSENTIVEVTILEGDKKTYKCVGVLMREDLNIIRLAFNAINDVVKDYLDIKRENILNIRILNSSEIMEI